MKKKDVPNGTDDVEKWRDHDGVILRELHSTVRRHSKLLTIYTIILVSAVCAGIIFL